MIESFEIVEVKSAIAKYLNVEVEILELEYHLHLIRYEFYTSRSLIGTAPCGYGVDDYQHSVSPFAAAVAIIENENTIQRRIDMKLKRQELLLEFIDNDDLKDLRKSQKLPYLSHLEQQVHEYIQEIEFYLESHKTANRQAIEEPKEVTEQRQEVAAQELSIMERIRGLQLESSANQPCFEAVEIV